MKQIAEKADAFTQSGGVAGHFYSAAKLTRASATYGAFSTPAKVTLPKVAADQVIEVSAQTFVLGGGGAALALAIGGVVVLEKTTFSEALWYPTFGGVASQPILTNLPAVSEAEAKAQAEAGAAATVGINGGALRFKHKSTEETSLVVELQGKIASGTMTIYGAYIAVRVLA